MGENQAAAEAALSTTLGEEIAPDTVLPSALPDAPEPEKAELKEPAKLSTRESVEKSLDALETKDKEAAEKDEAKAKVEEKPADKKVEPEKPKEEVKDQPEKAEKSAAPVKDDATGQDGEKARQSEGRNHHEPPARFLPKAKEVWANVPHAVKGEIARMSQEHENEVSQYRESHENWTKLAKFDQMAKQHNTTVNEALESYTRLDAIMHQNPIEGLRQIMERFGIQPRQYAEHIIKNPQAAQAPVSRAPDPQIQRTSSEVEALKAELQTIRQEQAAAKIIEPFRASHPRYDQLQGDIAFFLSSGKIPASLTPHERLEAAYDMAVRINPTSSVEAPEDDEEPAVAVHVPSDAGTKSVKGAPSSGHDPARRKSSKTNRDAAAAALSELGI